MLNQRYLDELRAHCETAVKNKSRMVDVDARALVHLINECEQHRLVQLIVEGRPLTQQVAA